MNLCTIIPLYKSKKKYNIISTSLFKLDSSYKNFKKYLNGINNWLEFIKHQDLDLYLRIYIDDSIKNDNYIMKYILKLRSNRLQLVYYKCPKFIKNNNNYYYLFGTFMRLIPLFDYKNNDTNYVIIRDLDVEKYNNNWNYVLIPIIKKQLIKKSGLFINVWGYEPKHSVNIINKWNLRIQMTISTNFKLKQKILDNYLSELLINKNKYSNIPKIKNRINSENPNFFYGLDEVFMNSIILNELYKYKNYIKIVNMSLPLEYIKNSVSKSLYYNGFKQLSIDIKNKNKYNELYKFILDNNEISEKYKIAIKKWNNKLLVNNYYL